MEGVATEGTSRAAVARAEALVDLGRPHEALEVLAPVLASDPNEVDAHLAAARAGLKAEEHSVARRHADTAVRLDPDDPYARFLLSLAYTASGHRTRAAAIAREAIVLDPRSALGHTALAFAGLGRPEARHETRAAAQAVLDRAPDASSSHLLVARSHMYTSRGLLSRSDRATARRHLERALAIDPHDTETRQELATLRALGGSIFASLAGHSSVLREDPTDAEARERIAAVLVLLPWVAHLVSWLVWVVQRVALGSSGGARTPLTWGAGAVALAVVVVVVVRLRRALGRATLPALTEWARGDRLGAAWLALLLLLNACTVTTAVDPSSPAVALGVPVLWAAVIISWVRRSRSS